MLRTRITPEEVERAIGAAFDIGTAAYSQQRWKKKKHRDRLNYEMTSYPPCFKIPYIKLVFLCTIYSQVLVVCLRLSENKEGESSSIPPCPW